MPALLGVFPPAGEPDEPCLSACLKSENASELSRPGPPPETDLEPVDEGVRACEPEAEGSSRDCAKVQPDSSPVKTMG